MIISKDERFLICGEASDGNQAIELTRIKRPDVVLMDINMSPIDGFEATKLIRKYSPGSKILGISMYSFQAYVKKIMAAGAKGYITKNSPVEEMLTAIATVATGETYVCHHLRNILDEHDLEENDETTQRLTKRELEIIGLIKVGLSSKEIAAQLKLSLNTIDIHRHNIFRKLKIKNLAALMNFTHTHGL